MRHRPDCLSLASPTPTPRFIRCQAHRDSLLRRVVQAFWRGLRQNGLALGVVAISSAPPLAADTLHVTRDTHTRVDQPALNFATSPTIEVNNASWGWAEFDLESVPAGVPISKAVLRMWVRDLESPGAFNVHRVVDAWEEGVITHATAPGLGSLIPTWWLPAILSARSTLVAARLRVQGLLTYSY